MNLNIILHSLDTFISLYVSESLQMFYNKSSFKNHFKVILFLNKYL